MISIVANFYKSEKYIHKLIKSVATQTFSNWELICVDDCSPGKDLEIIKKAITKYNILHKTKIISNKTNLGISKAKEVGIKAAKGEYITFIDGDDWLADEALEKMRKPALKYNLDIVIMNHWRFYNKLYKKEQKSNILSEHWDKTLNLDTFIDNYLINFFSENIFASPYWGKLYKTDVVKSSGFKFPDAKDSLAEDLLFNMAVFQKAQRFMFIDYAGYFWRYGGITSGIRKNDDWKLLNYIKRYAEIYPIRKNLIEKYNYERGYEPLLAQSKNLLIWGISRIASYNYSDVRSKKTIIFITNILDYLPYREIGYLLNCQEDTTQRKIIQAILDKDIEYIYNYCHSLYKKDKLFIQTNNFLRRVLASVIG